MRSASRPTTTDVVVPIISGLYGLLFGSFLNVVIHRVPLGQSVTKPRSRCPQCESELAWHDNVPVLSWLVLRGSCRTCAEPISARYPLVELITAVGFVAVSLSVGANWVLPSYLMFVAVLVALSGIDIDTRTIPNKLLYPAGFAGAALLVGGSLLDGSAEDLIWAAAGAALGFAVLFAIWFVAPGGMGYGDVRLSAYLGMYLGYQSLGHVAVGIFIGFLLGALSGIALMVVGGRGRKSKLPFGPFLALGAMTSLLAGQVIIDAYLGI